MSYNKQWSPKEDEWQQWSCGYCYTDNYNWASQAKKCKNCGLKRTFVMTPAAAGGKEQGTCWDAKWEPKSYAQALAMSSPVTPKPDAQLSYARVEAVISDAEVRAKATASLKGIMAALEALPQTDEFARERVMLEARAEEAKTKIRDAKPIGARIDGCKAAITRAQDRFERAVVQRDEALYNMKQANQELVQYKQDLAGLEISVAAEQQGVRQAPSSVEQLAEALTKVLKEMASSPSVPQQLVDETNQHMHHLYAGIQKIAAAASQAVVQAVVLPAQRQLMRATSSPATPAPIDADIAAEVPDPKIRRIQGKTPIGNTGYGGVTSPMAAGGDARDAHNIPVVG
jgi:hypothetical protein